ncbi:MAG TPA: alpha/beta hydrolase [Angustibacter sp.]|nr:alpha/beta hydrolase [Angustibacter sp.]
MTDLLSYDVAGAGSPVLLLHCGVANRQMWQPQWDALAADHQVVRPDFRAYGETPVPSTSWSDVDDVVALLDHLGLDRVAVVGSSYGGAIAMELATVAPQRISRLVLLCPGGDAEPTPDVESFSAAEEALLGAGDVDGAVDLNVRTWLGPEATDTTRRQLAGWQRHTFEVQADAPDDIGPQHVEVDPAAVDVRTTVVTGGHDLRHFQGIAHDLAARLPHARLLELDWAGHLPSLERPDDITALLLSELTD